MRLDLVCFGSPAVDLIHSGKGTLMRAGSPAMNTSVAFVQLGGQVGIIGRIGDDKYGNFLLLKFKKFGIDFSRLRVDQNPTNIIKIVLKGKERHIELPKTYYSVQNLNSNDVQYIKNSHAVFARFASDSFLDAVNIAKKLKKKIYVSGHFYDGKIRYDLTKYKITAIIGNKDEISKVRKNCKFSKTVPIAMTDGEKGSYAFLKGRKIHVPAFSVKAVDTTGAGDAFTAGYIFADMQGLKIKECLRFANGCAALIVQKYGAQQKISLQKVEKMLTNS